MSRTRRANVISAPAVLVGISLATFLLVLPSCNAYFYSSQANGFTDNVSDDDKQCFCEVIFIITFQLRTNDFQIILFICSKSELTLN